VEEANELIEAYNGRLAARVDGSVEEGELTNSCGRRWSAETEALTSTLARRYGMTRQRKWQNISLVTVFSGNFIIGTIKLANGEAATIRVANS